MTPKAIQLHFCPTEPAANPEQREPLAIEVRETEHGDIVMAAGIKDVARWLSQHGYVWQIGSKAMWVR